MTRSEGPGRRRRLRVAAGATAALLAGACGGGGGDEDRAVEPAASSTVLAGERAEAAERTREFFVGIGGAEPGCSVAVNVDGEIVFAEAFGAAVLEPRVPFATTTIVDIGSSSKQFTAIAVGRLIIDGEVAPDDPVNRYVDGLPAWAATVTVAQLLTHTSGIPDYIDLLNDAGVDFSDPADQADALEVIASEKTLAADPGITFDYSNSNYVLLAEVVAAVTGSDLPSWLAAELFGPLDLDASMTPGVALSGKAVSYERDGGWVVADSPWTQVGDGAVQTTPSQLAAFATTYWREGSPWRELAALREDLAVDTGEGDYSLGIETSELGGRTLLGHDGSWSGFETLFLVDPERRTAVALTCNSPDVDVDLDGLDARILELWTA